MKRFSILRSQGGRSLNRGEQFGARRLMMVLILFAAADSSALPDTLATGAFLGVDFQNPQFVGGCHLQTPGGGCTFGYDFTVNAPIVVEALGAFAFSDHFSENHSVGLWTAAGSLLASTMVTNASTPVGSADGSGEWLFNLVTPQLLAPGEYVIGAFYSNGSVDSSAAEATGLTPSEVTLGDAREASSSGLTYPSASIPQLDAGIFGPSFVAELPAPEPSPGVLFLSGVAGLGIVVWKRRG